MELDIGVLSRAFGREVSSYTVEPIEPELRIHSVTGGVMRVRADGASLVIKIVRHGEDPDPNALWVSGADPSHRNFWKREWLAFSTGFLDALPGELRAPRTLLTTENGPDECWIWMEDVEGNPGTSFELDDYDSVAFDLATTQAAFATGRSVLPGHEWLAHQWLRGWVAALAHRMPDLEGEIWSDERLEALVPLRPRLRELWSARETLLSIVETAPQTVVHCDFWPTNLIAADDGTTVAVDWSQVGIGAIAQDLDQLILDPVWMQVLPGQSLVELETHVLRGYVSGLRTSGADLSEAAVRRWYAAAASVHYAPMLAFMASVAAAPERLERRWGRPFTVIARDRARVIERALELGESVLG
ncbi:MAG: phosphotransferase [Frankiaceae bacterium]|nr:phosphotransferase [Frankiaceae bacterium]MBV9871450.1 phosphotransferase [Frankiaceae bacterium]